MAYFWLCCVQIGARFRAVHLLPRVLLPRTLLRAPLTTAINVVKNTVRSSAFLSAFIVSIWVSALWWHRAPLPPPRGRSSDSVDSVDGVAGVDGALASHLRASCLTSTAEHAPRGLVRTPPPFHIHPSVTSPSGSDLRAPGSAGAAHPGDEGRSHRARQVVGPEGDLGHLARLRALRPLDPV